MPQELDLTFQNLLKKSNTIDELRSLLENIMRDRRWMNARPPLRHNETAHTGFIGNENQIKYNVNTGHNHDGLNSRVIAHSSLSGIGMNTHAQIDSKLGYALQLSKSAAGNPADASTYYIATVTVFSSLQGWAPIYIPFPGTIKAVFGTISQVAGSAETSTLSLLLNGSTNIVISSTLVHNTVNTPFSKTDISQQVVAGDYIELKWITPTWATNPIASGISATVWVSC